MSDRYTSVDDFLPYLTPHVPNCPLVLVRQQVIETLRDYCAFTRCWRVELDPISIRADRTDYDLDGMPPKTDIYGVFLVERRDPDQDDALLQTLLPGVHYDLIDKETIRLRSKPEVDEVKTLRVTVWVIPHPTCLQIDERVFLNHYSNLIKGMLAGLHGQPGKTWTSEGLAAKENGDYLQARGLGRIEADRGHGMMTEERMTCPDPQI